MSRLQIVIAVGLFLIVGLFGWQSYLDKRAQETFSDQQGVPGAVGKSIQKDVDALKSANEAKEKTQKRGEKTEGAADKPEGTADKADAPKAKPETAKPAAGEIPKK